MMVYAERTHGGWIVLRVIFEGASEETGAFVIMFTVAHGSEAFGLNYFLLMFSLIHVCHVNLFDICKTQSSTKYSYGPQEAHILFQMIVEYCCSYGGV